MAAAKRKLNIKTYGIFVFWAILIVSTSVVVSERYTSYKKYLAEESEICEQIEVEKLREQELTRNKDYYSSDAFVEKVAREQLGLVMPDEILFYNDSRKQ